MSDIKVKMLKDVPIEYRKNFIVLKKDEIHSIGPHEIDIFVKAGYCEVLESKKEEKQPEKEIELPKEEVESPKEDVKPPKKKAKKKVKKVQEDKAVKGSE